MSSLAKKSSLDGVDIRGQQWLRSSQRSAVKQPVYGRYSEVKMINVEEVSLRKLHNTNLTRNDPGEGLKSRSVGLDAGNASTSMFSSQ